MDEQRPQCSFPRVQVSRKQIPPPSDCPDQEEELRCDELEERLAPGGCGYGQAKKTAGWGC
jgi:hypothetical protein